MKYFAEKVKNSFATQTSSWNNAARVLHIYIYIYRESAQRNDFTQIKYIDLFKRLPTKLEKRSADCPMGIASWLLSWTAGWLLSERVSEGELHWPGSKFGKGSNLDALTSKRVAIHKSSIPPSDHPVIRTLLTPRRVRSTLKLVFVIVYSLGH